MMVGWGVVLKVLAAAWVGWFIGSSRGVMESLLNRIPLSGIAEGGYEI